MQGCFPLGPCCLKLFSKVRVCVDFGFESACWFRWLKIDNIDGIFRSLDLDCHLMRVSIAEYIVVSG